jgi:hypothetical protein
MRKVTVPGTNVPIVFAGGLINPDWYPVFKFLEGLQPLSDIVFPPPDDTKSDVLRGINEQTGTSYTFVLTDSGKYCRFTNSSAVSVTVPTNASVAFQVGTQIDVIQGGAGKVTLSGSGVTINSLNGNKSLVGRYAGATLIKRATDEWDLIGSLTA